MKLEFLSEFDMPIKLESASQYLSDLESKLNRFLNSISKEGILSKECIERTKNNIENIKLSLKYTFETNDRKAKECISTILKQYRDNTFLISSLKDSYAFRGCEVVPEMKVEEALHNNSREEEVSFFKARIGEEIFKRKEMLHIPFNMRENVKTQRFSMPGIPCMYFGTTSYVCWLELDRPDNKLFNISSYKIPQNIKILNLVSDRTLIETMIERKIDKNLIELLVEIFPLIYATSYDIKNKNRTFKIEYVISQIIMKCLKDFEIDGVAYISKRLINNKNSYHHCINLAIPAKCKNEEQNLADICSDIKLTEPLNLSEYDKLKYKQTCNSQASFVNKYFEDSYIFLGARMIQYTNSQFSEIDNYLVSLEYDNY